MDSSKGWNLARKVRESVRTCGILRGGPAFGGRRLYWVGFLKRTGVSVFQSRRQAARKWSLKVSVVGSSSWKHLRSYARHQVRRSCGIIWHQFRSNSWSGSSLTPFGSIPERGSRLPDGAVLGGTEGWTLRVYVCRVSFSGRHTCRENLLPANAIFRGVVWNTLFRNTRF